MLSCDPSGLGPGYDKFVIYCIYVVNLLKDTRLAHSEYLRNYHPRTLCNIKSYVFDMSEFGGLLDH